MGVHAMHMMTYEIDDLLPIGPRKRVSIRRDNKDFVVAFQPADLIVFRNENAGALRRACDFLRWEVVSDT
jgi:hypothetical protein